MSDIKYRDLKEAYKKEKDFRVRPRIIAVNMVCRQGKSIEDTADSLMQSAVQSVSDGIRVGKILESMENLMNYSTEQI